MYTEIVAADRCVPKTPPRTGSHVRWCPGAALARRTGPPAGMFISAEHVKDGGLFELTCPGCDDWTQSYCVCITCQELVRELHRHRDSDSAPRTGSSCRLNQSERAKLFSEAVRDQELADNSA